MSGGDAMVVLLYLLGIFILAGGGGLLLGGGYLVPGALMVGIGVIWSGGTMFVVDLLVRQGRFTRSTGRH